MKVEAIALSDFVHGDFKASAGKLVRHRDGSLLEDGLARDLERAGLVRIRIAAIRKPLAGKDPAAGLEQPSSSLPAAQVSQRTTQITSKLGGSRNRRSGV